MVALNTPELWRTALPRPNHQEHKYHRGHTAILGSNDYTGATRLAAQACSRIGSGLVSVLNKDQANVYRATLPADIMVSEQNLSTLNRPNVLLAGPGGCNDMQAETVRGCSNDMTLILDANAIRLWPDLHGYETVLTPHEGEFDRYFEATSGSRSETVLAAAKACGHVLVLKGPETLIAGPNGRLVVNQVASPYLAKAGTGDVLAGMIAGLAAQGMSPFKAACAGVWLHGRAGQLIGPGLLPQDIQAELSKLLKSVLA